MTTKKSDGERKAWETLAMLKPADVCRSAAVTYETASGCYAVRSFGRDIVVSLKDRTVLDLHPVLGIPPGEYGQLFPLAVLSYLALAKDIVPTGQLVRIQDIRGGGIFTKGSHVLPLDTIAACHGKDKEGFLRRGKMLGGETMTIADASVRLHPLPRIPVTLTLWLADEEFPARTDLLFDSTASLQLPTDILWSLALMSVLFMR